MRSGEIARLESRRTLSAVKIVVEAGGPGNEERSADADQVDIGLEVALESSLAELESLLELQFVGEDGTVTAVFEDVFGGKSSEGIGAVERAGHLLVFVGQKREIFMRCKKGGSTNKLEMPLIDLK